MNQKETLWEKRKVPKYPPQPPAPEPRKTEERAEFLSRVPTNRRIVSGEAFDAGYSAGKSAGAETAAAPEQPVSAAPPMSEGEIKSAVTVAAGCAGDWCWPCSHFSVINQISNRWIKDREAYAASLRREIAALQERSGNFLHEIGVQTREIAALQAELASVDEALARRPALADFKNRYEKVCAACAEAGRADKFRAEIAALKEENQQLHRELELAIAHDRQPYPTAEAYEKVCAVAEALRSRIAELEGKK